MGCFVLRTDGFRVFYEGKIRSITTTGRDLPSDFLVNESELGSESESSSSEEIERGECGATTEKLS